MADDRRIVADCAKLDQIAATAFKPPPTCGECARFIPDPVNPPAGLGGCRAGHGYHYPNQRPVCSSHQPIAK